MKNPIPKIFISSIGMYRQKIQPNKLIRKTTGAFQYTVVSAVYNVAPYLNDYFNSLIKQTLLFKKHIRLILVDDGSTDDSAKIIQQWQQRFPDNIQYVYKENGGQASARNLGLQFVQTPWVTFIDPDDFVSENYFETVDVFLRKNTNVGLVSCPYIFYYEDEQKIKDSHPLKYRFANGNVILPAADLKNHMQLSVNSAFFCTQNIQKANVLFDEILKPSFEDAKFVAQYILRNQTTSVAFITKNSYFYRKRADASSTLDGSWQNPLMFSGVLEYGCLAVLQEAQYRLGKVPEYMQRIVLYHVIWYFKRIINRTDALSHLNAEQQGHFFEWLNRLLAHIEDGTIMRFNLAGAWALHKIGLLGLFKKQQSPYYFGYVEHYDSKKKQILLSYYNHFPVSARWFIDGREIFPVYQKTLPYSFMDKLFVTEQRVWLPCSAQGTLTLFINGKQSEITFNKKRFKELSLAMVDEWYQQMANIKNSSWILMDRDIQADDNAEHLYRYVRQHYPEQEMYFVLNRDAADWARLEQEGFNLLAFGSRQFEHKLRACDKIISSHADAYVVNYFKDNTMQYKDFVFLQHGVTHNNLSSWLNGKKIKRFITTTSAEYHSIVDDDSTYKFGKKEVILTGFPRHDLLLANNQTHTKQILIMPTWRNFLVGKAIYGSERAYNPEFMQSDYAQHWHGFLHNPVLKQLDEQGYQIVFALHPNLQEYADEFTLLDFIKPYHYADGSIQTLFQQSSIMITDYSSVAFEMAYLQKAVLYYQFDYDEVFNQGKHNYQKGYFDYERDGFGAVVYDEANLVSQLLLLVQNHDQPSETHLQRMKNTFAFRDTQNCERVYQAIVALDKPENVDERAALWQAITQAEQQNDFQAASERVVAFLTQYGDTLNSTEYAAQQNRLLHLWYANKKYANILAYLTEHGDVPNAEYWQVKANWQLGQGKYFSRFFAQNDIGNVSDKWQALLGAAYYQDEISWQVLCKQAQNWLPETHHILLTIAEFIIKEQYPKSLKAIEQALAQLDFSDRQVLKLEIMASYLCMRMNDLNQAHRYLERDIKQYGVDPYCRLAVARLRHLKGQNDVVFKQINWALDEHLAFMPEDLVPPYLQELVVQGNEEAAQYWLTQFAAKYPDSLPILHYQAEKLHRAQDWQALVHLLSNRPIHDDERLVYWYVAACCHLQQLDKAQAAFAQTDTADLFHYWKMLAEIAEANQDKALLWQCLNRQMMILQAK